MDDILTIFRALADPTRVRIMLLLLKMELAVGELAQILEQSQPRISRHIRILDEAGLAERRKEGSWVFLRPGKAPALDILQRIFRSDSIRLSDQATADEAKLTLVRKKRAEMAEQYFASHAAEWDAIRSLHLPEDKVEQAMLALVRDLNLGHMLDIGTGTGRMVELFGPHAEQVTALDNSPEMLRLARAKLLDDNSSPSGQTSLTRKTELKLGDFNRLPVRDSQINSVIMHQVLHYAQHPEAVLEEVARVLSPGGFILIADFAAHNFEELRTEHAHARLGFSDESMDRWLKQAGIELVQARSLDGGKLTVKIWVGRKSGLTRIHPSGIDMTNDETRNRRESA